MATIAKTRQPVRMPRFGHRVDKTDPILRGCVGWWPLNDGAGTKAADLIAGDNATASGGTSWVQTGDAVASELDGVDGYWYRSVNNTTDQFPQVSAAFWVIPGTTFDRYDCAFSRCNSSGFGWRFWTTDTSNHKLSFSLRNSTESTSATSATNLSGLGPTFYVGTFDGTNQLLYENGSLVASTTRTTVPGYSSGNSITSYIGAMRNFTAFPGAQRFFNGKFWNAREWSRCLSPSEVSRLYTEPWAGLEPLSPFSFFSVPTAGAPLAVFYNHYKNQGII